MTLPARRRLIVLLLIAGAMLWNWVSGTWIPALGVILAIALGAICAIPAIGRPAGRMLDKIRDPSPHNRFVASVLLAAATTLFLIFTATFYGRYLRPVWHDEFAYTLQTHMLAHGRLWMAPHPVGEFFESFYILHQPKYASLYFPGVALLYVWAIVLSLPLWIAAAMVAGITVGLFYRVTTELLDGVAGAVGAIILLSLAQFQEMALLVMAQVPMLLFALMMIWAFLRWRQRQGAGWALVLGCAAGWAAIIRPVDAICWAMPIGLAMLWDLKGKNLRTWVRSLGPLAAGATPFLILQVIFNVGVTGSAWKTPWQYYVDRDVPGGGVGIHKFDPSLRPQSTLPQKQDFYQKFIVPSLQSNDAAHLGVALDQRIHSVFDIGLPNVALLPLALVGLAGLDRRRWVFPGTIVLFLLLYLLYPFTMEHYALLVAPAVIFLLVNGIRVLEDNWPAYRGAIAAGFVTTLCLLCLLTQQRAAAKAHFHRWELLPVVDDALASVQAPAVVLFTYSPQREIHCEPVYNFEVAWPDDAPVIRAHDLGWPKNREIIDYYATHQPDRMFYRFDERTGQLDFLGSAKALAAAGKSP